MTFLQTGAVCVVSISTLTTIGKHLFEHVIYGTIVDVTKPYLGGQGADVFAVAGSYTFLISVSLAVVSLVWYASRATAHRFADHRSIETSVAMPGSTVTEGTSAIAPLVSSSLKISAGEHGSYHKIEPRRFRFIERTLLLRLENISLAREVTGIKIAVVAIEPQSQHDGLWTLIEGRSLSAGEAILVPFVRYQEAMGSAWRIGSRYAQSAATFAMLLSGEHLRFSKYTTQIVTLRATGIGTPPRDYRCMVWVDQHDAQLRIAECTGID